MRHWIFWCFVGFSVSVKNSVQHENVHSAQAQWQGRTYSIRVGTGKLGVESAAYFNCTTSSFFGVRVEERWITDDMLNLILQTPSKSTSKGVQGLTSRYGHQKLAVVSLLFDQDQYLKEQSEWIFLTKEDEEYFRSLLKDVSKCMSFSSNCKYDSRGLTREDDDEYVCVSQQALSDSLADLC